MRKKRSYWHLRMRNSRYHWTNTNPDLLWTLIPQSLHPPLISIPNHQGRQGAH